MCNKNGGGMSAKKTRYIALDKTGEGALWNTLPPLLGIVTDSVRADSVLYATSAVSYNPKRYIRYNVYNVLQLYITL